MFQRILIKKAWEKAGLTASRKKKVRDFIEFVEQNPQLGWEACAKEFRKNYSDAFDELIPPVLATGNNLIVLNLLRYLEPKKNKKELDLLMTFVTESNPQKLQPAFEAIAKLGIPSLNKALNEKKDLPSRVRSILSESKVRKA